MNLGNVPRWASFASLSTTPSSSPYTCQHKTSDTSYEKVQTRHKPLFLYIRFFIRHISVQYFPSIYTCCSTTIHIKPHISPQLQPLVFVSPQSERWWINKSCHGGREAPPFKSHLFANWENSGKSWDRITQSTFGDNYLHHLRSLWVEDVLSGKERLHVGHEEEDPTVVQSRQFIVKLWVSSFRSEVERFLSDNYLFWDEIVLFPIFTWV